MDFKVIFSTFVTILLAELGDKTQLAIFSFAAKSKSPLSVFIGAGTALLTTSLIATALGSTAAHILPSRYIQIAAGGLFILLGLLLIWGKM